MSGSTPGNGFAACFSQLGLPWERNDYYRADFYPGAGAGALGIRGGSPYNAKACLVGKVDDGECTAQLPVRSVCIEAACADKRSWLESPALH